MTQVREVKNAPILVSFILIFVSGAITYNTLIDKNTNKKVTGYLSILNKI